MSIFAKIKEIDRKIAAAPFDDVDDCGGNCSLMKNVECQKIEEHKSHWSYLYRMNKGFIRRHLSAKEFKRLYVVSGEIVLTIYSIAGSSIVSLTSGATYELTPATPHSIQGSGIIIATYEPV